MTVGYICIYTASKYNYVEPFVGLEIKGSFHTQMAQIQTEESIYKIYILGKLISETIMCTKW